MRTLGVWMIVWIMFMSGLTRACDSDRVRNARPRECAAICGHADMRVVDRVCRCADGKVTVLP